MEVHHQPVFLSGGGSAENPGENSIQVNFIFCEGAS